MWAHYIVQAVLFAFVVLVVWCLCGLRSVTGPFVHILDTRMSMEHWWSDGVRGVGGN